VDASLILRWTPTKTENTTAKDIAIDLRACPMVMEELEFIPQDARKGPLIVNQETGLPSTKTRYGEVWTEAKKMAGISPKVWNRDIRKSGSTEARAAGAPLDDVRKLMATAITATVTAQVYDLANIEAHQRIAPRSQSLPSKGNDVRGTHPE
jgi:hypothetical protein